MVGLARHKVCPILSCTDTLITYLDMKTVLMQHNSFIKPLLKVRADTGQVPSVQFGSSVLEKKRQLNLSHNHKEKLETNPSLAKKS